MKIADCEPFEADMFNGSPDCPDEVAVHQDPRFHEATRLILCWLCVKVVKLFKVAMMCDEFP